jgi:hypothetical protein
LFGSEILDVGIGLALLFLFMSLIATALRELIENILKSRSKNLERGITELLNTGNKSNLVSAFYTHPIIASLYKGDYQPGSKDLPSYIPRQSFSIALLDIVAGASQAGHQLSIDSLRATLANKGNLNPVDRVVLTALDTAENDLNRVRKTLEDWYDGTMDRVAGWYTRDTGRILGILGIAAAVFFNVDAITVAQRLINDKALRNIVVAQAQRYVEATNSGTTSNTGGTTAGITGTTADSGKPGSAAATLPLENVSQIKGRLDQIGFPIGWVRSANGVPYPFPQACTLAALNGGNPVYNCSVGTWVVSAPCGWIITALAIMLGAPFWFDVLNKFMVIRSTVKPKEKSPDEASVDRQPPPRTAAIPANPLPAAPLPDAPP